MANYCNGTATLSGAKDTLDRIEALISRLDDCAAISGFDGDADWLLHIFKEEYCGEGIFCEGCWRNGDKLDRGPIRPAPRPLGFRHARRKLQPMASRLPGPRTVPGSKGLCRELALVFRQRTAKEILSQCVAAALAGREDSGLTTLPVVESRLRTLQEEQMGLLQMAYGAGADCSEYDDRISQINSAMAALLDRKAELVREGRAETGYDSGSVDTTM